MREETIDPCPSGDKLKTVTHDQDGMGRERIVCSCGLKAPYRCNLKDAAKVWNALPRRKDFR